MSRVVVVLFTLAALLGCDLPASATVGLEVTVTRVVDGDTVHVTDSAAGVVKVRVLGIDTPETVKPNTPVQCYGPEATQYAKDHLLGQTVTLQPDASQASTDWRGRTLGYLVFADGADYSIEAARAGVAVSFVYDRKPVSKHDAIEEAEQEARAADRGLWGACPHEGEQ